MEQKNFDWMVCLLLWLFCVSIYTTSYLSYDNTSAWDKMSSHVFVPKSYFSSISEAAITDSDQISFREHSTCHLLFSHFLMSLSQQLSEKTPQICLNFFPPFFLILRHQSCKHGYNFQILFMQESVVSELVSIQCWKQFLLHVFWIGV